MASERMLTSWQYIRQAITKNLLLLGHAATTQAAADQRRIAAALEQLGWKRQKQSWDGKQYWSRG
jgi:hypothetical protein